MMDALLSVLSEKTIRFGTKRPASSFLQLLELLTIPLEWSPRSFVIPSSECRSRRTSKNRQGAIDRY